MSLDIFSDLFEIARYGAYAAANPRSFVSDGALSDALEEAREHYLDKLDDFEDEGMLVTALQVTFTSITTTTSTTQ